MDPSLVQRWEEEDAHRARSLTQHLCDTMALAAVVGAVNGFVVGVAAFWILGAVLGPAVGAIVALVLWIPGAAITWGLVRRMRSGRMSAPVYRRWTIGVVALLGAVPGVYALAGNAGNASSGLSARGVAVLVGVIALGAGTGAWAGRKLARLQLSRKPS